MSTQLSLSETAEILGVSEKSIRRYIKAGRMKASLVKGQKGYEYRIEKNQLSSFAKPPRGKNSHHSYPAINKAKKAQPIKNNYQEQNMLSNNMPKVSEIAQQNKERILYMAEKDREIVDYKLLYERLLAKYEHALIMIGSLEAQLNNNSGNIIYKENQIEESISRQEDLILELYQMLRLYQGQ